MSATLGYFNVRGIAQSVRLLLEYAKEPYTEKNYEIPESPQAYAEARKHQSGNEWFKEKYTLGLQFPTLPYLMIDGKKLTQTKAILKYLGRKHHLMPKSDCDHINAEILEEYLSDMSQEFGRLIFSNGTTQEHWTTLFTVTYPRYLKQLNDYMAGKAYAVGDYITYVDFYFYAIMEDQSLMNPAGLSDYPNLADYVKRMQSLPPIAAYIQSKRSVELVEISKAVMAKFTGKA